MILLTAATPWEAGPLTRRWGLKSRDAEGPRLFEGRLARQELRLVQTGVGAARSTAALLALEGTEFPLPQMVASVGFAGALQAGIRPGELVADLRGAPLDWLDKARETALALRTPLHLGALACAERVLGPEEKRSAGAIQRAVAVDMESAAVRAWCGRRSTLFLGVRVVFDALDERAPQSGPADDSASAVMRYAAAHWRTLPRLLRLWPRQALGMAALGRFLEQWLDKL